MSDQRIKRYGIFVRDKTSNPVGWWTVFDSISHRKGYATEFDSHDRAQSRLSELAQIYTGIAFEVKPL